MWRGTDVAETAAAELDHPFSPLLPIVFHFWWLSVVLVVSTRHGTRGMGVGCNIKPFVCLVYIHTVCVSGGFQDNITFFKSNNHLEKTDDIHVQDAPGGYPRDVCGEGAGYL